MELADEEITLLKQYQVLSTTTASMINRLAIEIVPPILFIVVWVFTEKTLFLLAAMAIMVLYNVQRVVRQHKNMVALSSISNKALGCISGKQ